MELTSFQWGFSRSAAGARSSLNDPIKFSDLTFQRTTDTASNDLYAQTALQTSSANPARLRLVDNGVNLLRFNLNDSRLTKFATTQGQTESGALSFSNVAFTRVFWQRRKTRGRRGTPLGICSMVPSLAARSSVRAILILIQVR